MSVVRYKIYGTGSLYASIAKTNLRHQLGRKSRKDPNKVKESSLTKESLLNVKLKEE